MKSRSLKNNWQLLERPLCIGAEGAADVLGETEGWMDVAAVPADVHTILMQHGKIADPYVADGTDRCLWVEKRSWWFKKTFTLTEEELSCFGAELFLETLDVHADVFVNGTHAGHHASAFYPFRKNIKNRLVAGENVLLVRLTTGLEHVTDEEAAPVRDFVACEWRTRRKGRGEDRRSCLRKPQHVFGWDQSPHLATICIAGDARIDFLPEVVVRDVRVETLSLGEEGAKILCEAEVESTERSYARECSAVFTFEKDGKVLYEKNISYMSQTGVNYLDFSFTLPEPELWWPNGYGAQPLYTARVTAAGMNGTTDEKAITTGIRTVTVDQTAYKEGYRRYAFVVNGKRIYAKGMDFIQTKQLYAEITEADQEKLISRAKAAGFSMLRFWDGNRYHEDYVYDICDRYGILVFQNFMFACGAYPDHLDRFVREVEKEAQYQVKRLRSHPCIALWCGNGECHGILKSYFGNDIFKQLDAEDYPAGTKLYNEVLPRICHQLTTAGYQCCSPFGGFQTQEAPERGDCHYYPFLNLAPENQQNRISVGSFDPLDARFITESGVMGPPSAEAFERFLGGKEHYEADDAICEHHRNTFERYAVRDGIYKHYTGERKLSFEEYCLYGGLFQGHMLSYASDHVRLMEECGGSLFWCFNDGFGEVGFSLMDHEGNPKPAYYFLKRAYAANRVILRRKDDRIEVWCGNDSDKERRIDLVCGYVTFEGAYAEPSSLSAVLPAFAPETLFGSFAAAGDDHQGVFYARPCEAGPSETAAAPLAAKPAAAASNTPEVTPTATLRADDFRNLNVPADAGLSVTDLVRDGETITFTVTAEKFAHAVHFGLPAEKIFSDQYFDLLPGESRRVTLYNAGSLAMSDLAAHSVHA